MEQLRQRSRHDDGEFEPPLIAIPRSPAPAIGAIPAVSPAVERDDDVDTDLFTPSGLTSAEASSTALAESQTDTLTEVLTEVLTERERQILAFERQWWRHAGAKEQAIRDQLDLSATRYYQLLNAVLDKPAALVLDPVLVGRLRRLRGSRARGRTRS